MGYKIYLSYKSTKVYIMYNICNRIYENVLNCRFINYTPASVYIILLVPHLKVFMNILVVVAGGGQFPQKL